MLDTSEHGSSPNNNETPSKDTKENWIKTTCAYCGVGCGIESSADTKGKISVRGDVSHPANYGRLCSKGLALGESVIKDGRLQSPSIDGENVSWNKALDHVAKGFAETIEQYGPDSVAFYVSGQLLTEDYYVANKLMKGYMGSGNIDTNSRLCMSSSVAGHKRAFGSDTVPNCYEDFELADLVVLVGSNLAWCHPVIYQRLKAAKEKRPELKVVVIDPRATDTCEIADLHLAIQPGTDVALFNGLLVYLSQQQRLDTDYIENHTQGFSDALLAASEDCKSEQVLHQNDTIKEIDLVALSKTLGVPLAYLETFYSWFADTEKVLSVYSQGVNQSSAGTDKVNSIINCHLVTGRIGKPGSGPFSITGQPNAMGGREVGGLSNMLAAHMEFGNQEHWQTVSDFWQSNTVAKKPGLKAVDLFDALADGKIKAIWIMATNPVVSMPDANKVKAALEKCPLVVVSDCIADTDTTRCANVLLPAMAWAEKSGTVTNSERRISRQRQVIAATGEAKADWWIMSQVAQLMGYAGFNYNCAADVFREYAEMTGFRNHKKRDLDISALATLSNQEYDNLSPQQWPLKEVDTNDKNMPQRRFFANGLFYTPNRKANIVPVRFRPPATPISRQYPMVLNTGRIRDQWHTMTRTSLVAKLNGHKPEPFIQIHPQDARYLKLNKGDIAQIDSQWGQALARVDITENTGVGQAFMPMHWNGTNSSNARICSVINSDVDPVSGQPELKHTSVSIKPWRYVSEAIVIIRDTEEPEIDSINHKLGEDSLKEQDYWVKRKIESGTLYYLAQKDKQKENKTSLIKELQVLNIFQREGNNITFDNQYTGNYRSAKMINGTLQAVCIVSSKINNSDYAWLDSLFEKELSVDIQRSILSGIAAPSLISGKQICACKQVGELTIKAAITEQGCTTVDAIGESTEAGTGCGSCLPELNQLLNDLIEDDLAKTI